MSLMDSKFSFQLYNFQHNTWNLKDYTFVNQVNLPLQCFPCFFWACLNTCYIGHWMYYILEFVYNLCDCLPMFLIVNLKNCVNIIINNNLIVCLHINVRCQSDHTTLSFNRTDPSMFVSPSNFRRERRKLKQNMSRIVRINFTIYTWPIRLAFGGCRLSNV